MNLTNLKDTIMAFLPGIFGTAFSNSPAPAPAPAPAGPPPPNSATNPANPMPGSPAPAPGNAAALPAPPNSAMDTLMQLMTPSAEVVQQRAAQQEAMNKGIFPEVKPEQIQQSLATADFTTGLNPEMVQKALTGDAAAFMAVMNTVARNSVASGMQLTQGMVEHGVKTGTERFSTSLDSRFRELQLRNQNVENPALNHPLAKGILQSISSQIANANPRLSPAEVAKQAESNFLQFAKDLSTPSPGSPDATPKPPEKNWLRYMDDGSVESSNTPST